MFCREIYCFTIVRSRVLTKPESSKSACASEEPMCCCTYVISFWSIVPEQSASPVIGHSIGVGVLTFPPTIYVDGVSDKIGYSDGVKERVGIAGGVGLLVRTGIVAIAMVSEGVGDKNMVGDDVGVGGIVGV